MDMASGSAPFLSLYQSKASMAILVNTDQGALDKVWMKLAASGDELRPFTRLHDVPASLACQPQQACDLEQAATSSAARRVVVGAPSLPAASDIAQVPTAAGALRPL